jgi:M6 family metalloprotease-like protein
MNTVSVVRLVVLVAALAVPAIADAQSRFRGLLVLIDFPDRPANMSLARAEHIINGIGYTEPAVTRSMRDYWRAQSRGQVDLTHHVVGYYRAPQPASWYETQTFHAFIALATEALDWVVTTNPDFDWDGLSRASGPMNRRGDEEGSFLAVSFMTTAWIPGTGGTHELPWTAPNGVSTKQIVGATFQAPWDTSTNLFWLTHELGHSIWGWPDTYDHTGLSRGTGLYSLMSGNQGTGDIEPVGGPFLAAEAWVRVVDVHNTRTVVLEADGDAVVRHRNPVDPREYFVVEARSDQAVGNAAFPAHLGLLIWHIDERVPLTVANTHPQRLSTAHYRVSIEQADGVFDLEENVNAGDFGDIYLPGRVFDRWSTVNSSWWDGSPSDFRVTDIRFLPNARVAFRVSTRD